MIFKSKAKQVELILITYSIESNISKMLSLDMQSTLQHYEQGILIFCERLQDLMCVLHSGTSQVTCHSSELHSHWWMSGHHHGPHRWSQSQQWSMFVTEG